MMLSISERPRKFSEVIGHDRKMREFSNMSKNMNFPSIMIFDGVSGVGKTSVARIIAALLVDNNPIINKDGTRDPNPDSPSTKAIINEVYGYDVHFFNASGMTKKDVLDLDLLASTGNLFGGKNKVIIIDEAQELSGNAKGATMGFLEADRPGVYIILCTMDLEAFHKAVKGRGQLYTFKAPSMQEIAQYLVRLFDKVAGDVEVPDTFFTEGIPAIIEAAEGSIRESIQTFQRCVTGEYWTKDAIFKEFSIVTTEDLSGLLYSLMDGKPKALNSILEVISAQTFGKMYAALADALIFKTTGTSQAGWRLQFSKTLSSHRNFPALMACFDDIFRSQNGYFRPEIFSYRICEFLNRVNAVPAGLNVPRRPGA